MQPDAVSLQDVAVTIGSPPFIFCLGIAILVLFYVRRNPALVEGAGDFLRATPWRLEDSIALAMLLVFFLFLSRSIISVLMLNGVIEESHLVPLSVVLQTALFHVPIILIVLLRTKKMTNSIMPALGIRGPKLLEDVGKGLLAYLASMPAIAAANLSSWMVLQSLRIPPEPQFAVQILFDPHPAWLKLYLIGMAVISAPVAEELLFRFICFPSLAKRTSPMRAALLISLLFAVIHLNAYAFLPLFVMAMALCAAYAWTRSIVVPLTMHAVFNAVNLSLYILYKFIQQQG